MKKIEYRVETNWNCQACNYYGIPRDNVECFQCNYTGKQIRKWKKERELINKMIDMYNAGEIKVEE